MTSDKLSEEVVTKPLTLLQRLLILGHASGVLLDDASSAKELASAKVVLAYEATVQESETLLLALRAAVLGDMPPAEAAKMYRGTAAFYSNRGGSAHAERYDALADAVEEL